MNKAQREERIRQVEARLIAALVAYNEALQRKGSTEMIEECSREKVSQFEALGGTTFQTLKSDLQQAEILVREADVDLQQVEKTLDELELDLMTLKGQTSFDFVEPIHGVIPTTAKEAETHQPVFGDAIVDEIDMTMSRRDGLEYTVKELAEVYKKQPLKKLRRLYEEAKKRNDHLADELQRFDREIAEAKENKQEAALSTLKFERRFIVEAKTEASVNIDALIDAIESHPGEPSFFSVCRQKIQWRWSYGVAIRVMLALMIAIGAVAFFFGADYQEKVVASPLSLESIVKQTPAPVIEPVVTVEEIVTPKLMQDVSRCNKCLKAVAGLGVPGKEHEYCAEFCS